MIWFGALAGLAALVLLGWLVLAAAGVRAAGHDAVTAFVTGAALLATLGMAAIALGLPLSLIPPYGIAALLALFVWRRRTLSAVSIPAVRGDAVRTLALVATAAVIAAVVFSATRDRLWWDGWAIWALKARVLYVDGTLSREFLRLDSGYGFAHLDYPLAVPLVDWWVFRHAGAAAPALASFAGAVWFALLPLLLWSSLRTRVDARLAALAALGMAAFRPIAFYATGGTADVVIALALLGAIVELERAVNTREGAALVRCGIYLTLGILAKNEGLAIAAVVLVTGTAALVHAGERRLLRLAPLALPFVALAPWWLASAALGLREAAVSWSQLGAAGERAPAFAARIAALGVSVPWLPVPLIAVAGAVSGLRQRDAGLAAGWTVVAAYFAVVTAIYLLTPHDLYWLMDTSLPRVLGAFVPAVVYLSVRGVAAAPQAAGSAT